MIIHEDPVRRKNDVVDEPVVHVKRAHPRPRRTLEGDSSDNAGRMRPPFNVRANLIAPSVRGSRPAPADDVASEEPHRGELTGFLPRTSQPRASARRYDPEADVSACGPLGQRPL